MDLKLGKKIDELSFITSWVKYLYVFYYLAWFRSKLLEIVRMRLARVYMKGDGAILDVGGSNRHVLSYGKVAKNALTVNIARREKPDVLASATSLPFRPKTFKTIAMVQMFYAIPERKRTTALAEVIRLAPDRIIIDDCQKIYSVLTQFFPKARIIPHQKHYLFCIIDNYQHPGLTNL
jgi:hypothetical protein